MPNNKLANELPKKLSGQFGGFDLDVGRKVLTKVDLNFNDENIIINDKDKKFTQYDRSVYNAICSLLEVGNSNFTPDRVYRCMNGLTDSEYVSPQSIGAITKSIDKARKTYCKIDYTEEMKSRNKNTTQCFIEDFILSAQKVSLEAGGNEVEGYRLNSKPILYQYAQETKQVLTIPIELLNTKEFRKSTPEFTVIKEYLIRQIEWMKTDRNRSNRIIFETLFDEVDIKNPTKDKAKKVRNEMVSPFLESLKSKKYIKGFNFYKEGRSFKGVEILY